MMKTIPKLNKRLIYGCLTATSAIAIPLIVIPMASQEKGKSDKEHSHKMAMQASIKPNDAFTISGTEKFPASYAELKGFEKELKEKQTSSDTKQVLKVLNELEHEYDKEASGGQQRVMYNAHYDRDDPWHEARKREEKRQAFDRYDARRSDIMFIDHSDRKNKRSEDDADPTANMMAAHNPSPANQNDMFFTRKEPIGQIKEALPYIMSQGTLIPAILQTEIDTSLPGPILARVSQNIWDSKTGKTLLIPQNSTLIGEYNSSVGHGQKRAQIAWSRIIFPNQQSVALGAMVGVDKKGTSGISGSADNHYDKVALGLLLTTTLGAGVRMSQGKYDANTAIIGQDLGHSLAQETARLGNKITDKMLSIPPTIRVPMGQRLNVFVEQDLSLQPYAG
jgi:type IV secretory pathway VirB10-like protein